MEVLKFKKRIFKNKESLVESFKNNALLLRKITSIDALPSKNQALCKYLMHVCR